MITPADSPSSPADYASVAVSQMDIQAPAADLSAACDAAQSAAMARQPQAAAILDSPQGSGAMNVTAGWTGDWPADVEPGG